MLRCRTVTVHGCGSAVRNLGILQDGLASDFDDVNVIQPLGQFQFYGIALLAIAVAVEVPVAWAMLQL